MNARKKLLISLLGGVGLFALLMLGMIGWFGSMGATVAWLNGESVYIYPKKIDLGNQEPGTETVVTFYMKNLTSKEISVVGEKSSCTCAFSEKIPISAKVGNTAELKVNIHLPKYESTYDQVISFMIAEPNRLALHPVQVTAKVPNPLPVPQENENNVEQ